MSSEMLPPMDHAHRWDWEVPRTYAAAGLTSSLSPLLSAPLGTEFHVGMEQQPVADCESSHGSLPFSASVPTTMGLPSFSHQGVSPFLHSGLALPLWPTEGGNV